MNKVLEYLAWVFFAGSFLFVGRLNWCEMLKPSNPLWSQYLSALAVAACFYSLYEYSWKGLKD